MWKFFSRGVRETLEKGFRIVKSSEKALKNDTTEHTTYCRKYTPCCLQVFTKYKCTNKEYSKENKHKSAPHEAEHTIFDAVSYSGALVIGWFLTQPCLWRKWWLKCSGDNNEKVNKPNLIHLIGKVANTQPINVGIHSDSTVAVNRTENSEISNDAQQFGPKTAEEVLNEAAEELRAVNDSVIALAENTRGVDYISERKNREAVALFRSASRRGYAPAAYNLAQCYEMGIGTKQDFVEAAKWYRIAADKGHATAKYNLGVFYAHGWGGLKPNSTTARKLFEEAAAKGQPDAKAALGLDVKDKPPPKLCDLQGPNDWGLSKETEDSSHIKSDDPNELYSMALSYEPSVCDDIAISAMVMNLHKMASDMGHAEAKARFQLLEAYEAIGLLQEFLCGRKRSEANFFIKGFSPSFTL